MYQHPERDDWVIKVARPNPSLPLEKNPAVIHNRNEYTVWQQWESLREWLAPVISISSCGRYLTMQKGESVDRAPEEVPMCIEDRRVINWVRLNGKVVCCDYGEKSVIRAMEKGEWHLIKP